VTRGQESGYVNVLSTGPVLISHLKALVASYLRGNIPLADIGTIQIISDAISVFKGDVYFPAINAELETRQRVLQSASREDAAQGLSTSTWRQKIRTIVDALMFPDEPIWTDDEENSTDHQFAQHCLTKVQLRFERYVKPF
jgi:serine/threonine-protein kinase ATR